MRIKTTTQINTLTQDGRGVTADAGEVLDIDPDDAALVGFARSLIMSGQAEHYGDAGDVDEELAVEPAEEQVDEVEDDAEPDTDEDD